jgi:hypothetical protein
MKRWGVRWIVAVAVGVGILGGGASIAHARRQQAAAGAKAEAKPIQQLAWLQGGVWVADGTKLGPGLQKIETRYQWSDNSAYLRFTTHFVFEKGIAKQYDGNMYWDADKKGLAIWYMDAAGEIIQGPMEWSGDVLKLTFHGDDFDGNKADLLVEVTRKNNDHYHWVVSEKQGSSWKQLGELDYLRQPDAASHP